LCHWPSPVPGIRHQQPGAACLIDLVTTIQYASGVSYCELSLSWPFFKVNQRRQETAYSKRTRMEHQKESRAGPMWYDCNIFPLFTQVPNLKPTDRSDMRCQSVEESVVILLLCEKSLKICSHGVHQSEIALQQELAVVVSA